MTAEKFHDALSLLPSDLIAEADACRSGKAAPKVIFRRRYAAMAACFLLILGSTWFASRLFVPKGATEAAMQAPAAAPMDAPAAAAPVYEEAPAAEAAPEEYLKRDESSNTSGSGTITEDAICELPAASGPEENVRETSGIVCQRIETPLKPTTASFSSNAAVTLVRSQAELEQYLSEKDWIYDFSGFSAIHYEEDWFAGHDLLLLTVHAAHPDVPYTVTAIEHTGGADPMGWDWYVLYATAGENHPQGKITCFHLLTTLEKGQISPEDSILPVADPVF